MIKVRRKLKNEPYFLKAMERAALSPSRYSSVVKKSKLESMGFRPSLEAFLTEEEPDATSIIGEPFLVSFVILMGLD